MGNSLKTFWRFGYDSTTRSSGIVDSHFNLWAHVIGPFYLMIRRGRK